MNIYGIFLVLSEILLGFSGTEGNFEWCLMIFLLDVSGDIMRGIYI